MREGFSEKWGSRYARNRFGNPSAIREIVPETPVYSNGQPGCRRIYREYSGVLRGKARVYRRYARTLPSITE